MKMKYQLSRKCDGEAFLKRHKCVLLLVICLFACIAAGSPSMSSRVSAATTTSSSKKKIKRTTKNSRLILVGASRIKQMNRAIEITRVETWKRNWKITCIAKGGGKYTWFKNKALKKLKKELKKYPCSKVVIMMGNNDLKANSDGMFSKYAKIYKKLIKDYPNAEFYFLDSTPSRNVAKNKLRMTFNAKLAKRFGSKAIGGFYYLDNLGYRTSYNKEHYDEVTSRWLFRYVLEKIGIKAINLRNEGLPLPNTYTAEIIDDGLLPDNTDGSVTETETETELADTAANTSGSVSTDDDTVLSEEKETDKKENGETQGSLNG